MNDYVSLITGGAGFMGSHLTERLLKKGYKVSILDIFSSGNLENIKPFIDNSSLTLIKEDLKKPSKLNQIVGECKIIFHLAANPEVKVGETNPQVHFEENILNNF